MLSGSFVLGVAVAALLLHFMADKDSGKENAAAEPVVANKMANHQEERDAALREAQQRKAMAEVGK